MRYFAGALAFGFAAVWIMASLAAALVCLLSAAAGYGAVLAVERLRAKRGARADSPIDPVPVPSPSSEQERQADELNQDLGYVYEPSAPTSHTTAEREYGWPPAGDTATASETRQ